jgi:predicted dinucleotide-binding enzyme
MSNQIGVRWLQLQVQQPEAERMHAPNSKLGDGTELGNQPPFRIATIQADVVGVRRLPRIAVLGSGHSGPVIARAAVEAGYQVAIAASGDPQAIGLITQVLVPGAEPRWAADAVADADVVVLAIPIHKFATFDAALVTGKIVVDVMNYWPPVDGVQAMFEDRGRGSSEIVQERLATSTVVKTLNHFGYHELDEERRPEGSPDRRAMGVAGDDPGAVDVVARIIERIGFDSVQLDSLRAGRLFEAGGPVFGASLRRAEFQRAVRAEAA